MVFLVLTMQRTVKRWLVAALLAVVGLSLAGVAYAYNGPWGPWTVFLPWDSSTGWSSPQEATSGSSQFVQIGAISPSSDNGLPYFSFYDDLNYLYRGGNTKAYQYTDYRINTGFHLYDLAQLEFFAPWYVTNNITIDGVYWGS